MRKTIYATLAIGSVMAITVPAAQANHACMPIEPWHVDHLKVSSPAKGVAVVAHNAIVYDQYEHQVAEYAWLWKAGQSLLSGEFVEATPGNTETGTVKGYGEWPVFSEKPNTLTFTSLPAGTYDASVSIEAWFVDSGQGPCFDPWSAPVSGVIG